MKTKQIKPINLLTKEEQERENIMIPIYKERIERTRSSNEESRNIRLRNHKQLTIHRF